MPTLAPGVAVWWASISAVSVVNLVAWVFVGRALRRSSKVDELRQQRRPLFWLATAFTWGCAFRSFLPRAEAERLCLVDAWISNAPIARAVATVAELCLVAQWALTLRAASRDAGSRTGVWLSHLLVPFIAVAEVFSWYSALSTNFLGSVVEESLWALSGALLALGLLVVRGRQQGLRRAFLSVGAAATLAYVIFMCTVDVPMYWRRWREDEARNKPYLTIAEGWRDANSRRVVTGRWEDWREEMPWMSLYFSVGVWVSLALVLQPRRMAARSEVVTGVPQSVHMPSV
ncbi:MAG: hypothetical protein ACT4TC_17705 [Myxococcaceae bacterium]